MASTVKGKKKQQADIAAADKQMAAMAPGGAGRAEDGEDAHLNVYRKEMKRRIEGKLHLLTGMGDDGYPLLLEMPDSLNLRVDGTLARRLLGWETEDQYVARMTKDNPNLTAERCLFKNLDDKELLAMPPWFKFGFVAKEQVNVICWNNDRNRPIDLKRCEEFAQTILKRQWAGPSTLGSINGESGVIGETGVPLSCQHCLVGLLIAIDRWESQPTMWQEFWPEEPYIEKLIVVGVSESEAVVQTLDNVRPRSLEDELYVGDEFRDLIPVQRREVAKLAASAIDYLWKRTRAASLDHHGTKRIKGGAMTQYITHAVAREFLSRHERLKKCVRFLFDRNRKEKVLCVSSDADTVPVLPGIASAMLYLMGCSASNPDDYVNANPLPSEKVLDWSRWDQACKFWIDLTNKDCKEAAPIRRALRELVKYEDMELEAHGGALLEKTCVLAMSWEQLCAEMEPDADSLQLTIHQKRDGSKVLVNRDTFGGIDVCHVVEPDLTDPPTEEEIAAKKEEAKEAARKKQAEAEEKKMEEARKRQAAKDAKAAVAAGTGKPNGAAKPNLDAIADKAKSNLGKDANGKPLTAKQKVETRKQEQLALNTKLKEEDQRIKEQHERRAKQKAKEDQERADDAEQAEADTTEESEEQDAEVEA